MKWIVLFVLAALPVHALADDGRLADAVVDLDSCSGTIIVKGEKQAYGVSAAHCAVLHSEFGFTTATGSRGNARWIAVDREHDLAMFSCWSNDILVAVPVLTPLPDKARWSAVGFPSRHSGTIDKPAAFLSTGDITEKGSNRTIKDRNAYRLDSWVLRGGESGGAVFAVREQAGLAGLVGVISHGRDSRTMQASTNRSLVSFLQANESKMVTDCRNGYCERWDSVPPPPADRDMKIGSHDLPEFMDSDRERGLLIQQLLDQVAELRASNAELRKLVMAAPRAGTPGRDGEPGPAGLRGERGLVGPQGPAGPAAAVDVDELVRDVLSRIPPREPIDFDQLALEVKKRLPPIPASFQIKPLKREKTDG